MPIHASVGNLSFPLADTGATSLASFDQARDVLLGLMAAAITYELQPRWADAIAGTPLGEVDAPPVKTQSPCAPTEDLMKTAGLEFPLLTCYRDGEATVERIGIEQALFRQNLVIEYVMAPWTQGTERKVQDVFKAIVAIAYECVRAKGHTAYAMDETYPTQAKAVLGPGVGCANFYELAVVNAAYGAASFSQGGPRYNGCRITFNAAELVTDDTAESDVPYLGETLTHNLGTADDNVPAYSGAYTEHEDV